MIRSTPLWLALLATLAAGTVDKSSTLPSPHKAAERGVSKWPLCDAAGCRLRGGQSGCGAGRHSEADQERVPDVVRPIASDDEVPRASAGGYAAAEEIYSVATQGLGGMELFEQSAESLLPCSEDDSLDSDDPVRRVCVTTCPCSRACLCPERGLPPGGTADAWTRALRCRCTPR